MNSKGWEAITESWEVSNKYKLGRLFLLLLSTMDSHHQGALPELPAELWSIVLSNVGFLISCLIIRQ
jgi:hypothetical protein